MMAAVAIGAYPRHGGLHRRMGDAAARRRRGAGSGARSTSTTSCSPPTALRVRGLGPAWERAGALGRRAANIRGARDDRDEPVDLFVIGGGINGAGIARDAAGRGLSVVLCEKDDLAEGTSSRSGKLVHGGLRYLEYYEFRLVREALIEREVLLKAAPHIIWPMRFVLPHSPEDRPGVAGAARPVLLRPSRRPQAAAGHAHPRSRRAIPRACRCSISTRAASNIPIAGSTTPGSSCSTRVDAAERGAQVLTRIGRGLRAPRGRRDGRVDDEEQRHRRDPRHFAPAASSTRRAPGSPTSSGVSRARTPRATCGWSRAATSSCRNSGHGRERLSGAEPRQARHLHQPLRGRSRADRHDRHPLRRPRRRRDGRRERDRLSARAR